MNTAVPVTNDQNQVPVDCTFLIGSIKDRQVAKLRIWTFGSVVARTPVFRSVRQNALRGGVTHVVGRISKHVAGVLELTELCKGVWNPGPQDSKSSTMKITTWHSSKVFGDPVILTVRSPTSS